MPVLIVDTSVWIDFFRGNENEHVERLVHEIRHRRVALTDMILCELLRGIRSQADFERTRRELSTFTVFNTGGESMALASANNYRALRAKGLTVSRFADCMIATFCVLHGHPLLHRDGDFVAFEKHLGLRAVHPVQ